MSEVEERVEWLERLGRGELAPRDLAGLGADDLDALAQLGRVTFESGRFEQAARLFAGLEALEPDVPAHSLRRAHAEARATHRRIAIEVLDRYLDREDHRPNEDLQDALLLRANLLKDEDPEAAMLDVRAARHLGRRSGEGAR